MSVVEQNMRSLLGPDFFRDGWTKFLPSSRQPGKPQDVVHVLELSLEKLYTGTTIQIKADKKIPCQSCSKGRVRKTCPVCNGVGSVSVGSVVHCPSCNGKAVLDVVCTACKGKGIFSEAKFHTVKVPPGSKSGRKIRIAGEGDALIGQPDKASDIVCTIKEKPHPQYRRCGSDLYILKNIGLVEALCGFQIIVNHLDGRKILANNPPGKVVKPGDMRYIRNEGMPVNSSAKGDLIIVFNVIFPKKLPDASTINDLESLLPPKTQTKISSDCEEFILVPFDPKEQVYHVPFRQREAYSDDQSPMKEKRADSPTCPQQ